MLDFHSGDDRNGNPVLFIYFNQLFISLIIFEKLRNLGLDFVVKII